MKSKIRLTFRKILKCKKNETILDCLERYQRNIKKKVRFKQLTLQQFDENLTKIGIKKGDNIFIQASWNALGKTNFSPEEIVDILMERVGETGNIFMPSGTKTYDYINIKNTQSEMGILSEIYRNKTGVVRSLDSYFPIIGYENREYNFLEDHKHSQAPFDELSPLYQLSKKNGKLLFIGMGKYPYKVTYSHVCAYSRKNWTFYKKCFTKELTCRIEDGDNVINKKITVRDDTFSNNNKIIQKIMKNIVHRKVRTGNDWLYSCKMEDFENTSLLYETRGKYLYKIRKRR